MSTHDPHLMVGNMTPVAVLEAAAAGRARFTIDRRMTDMGHFGYWEIETIGEVPCESYYAHGGFLVTTQPVVHSRLTEKGARALCALKLAGCQA